MTATKEPLENWKGLAHIGAPSRGIVLFNNGKYAMWECPDGAEVIRWAESYVKPGNPYHDASLRNSGVKHAVVWIVAHGDVTYESTD